MAYTTEAKIRQEAGFQNNANITEPVITQYQTRAFNVVNGYVARRYSLSLLSGASFAGSQAQSVLEQAELLLAAGNLLNDQYSGQQMGETNGQKKIDSAQKILDDIAAGVLKLLDINGDELTSDVPSAAGISPMLTSPPRLNANPESSERKFSVDKRW